VNPNAAAIIAGMSDRSDGPGQTPANEKQLSRMLINQKQLGEVEGLFQEKLNPYLADQTDDGADSIERESLGLMSINPSRRHSRAQQGCRAIG
jgi:hypothetical protein